MDKHIISFFENHKLELKNKKIVIAVSTGVDSMVLLYAFLLLKEEFNLKIYVAHVNHQKRVQSIEEEQFIKEFCEKHDIGCFVYQLEKVENQNFQSYAREERYEFFKKVMNEVNADYLLLAHHAIDNMETILMRMIRGSNLKGYSGIDSITKFNNKLILRPLLDVLKDEIIEFSKLHKIKYYQDVSNFEDVYTRNRIRKKMIPLLFKEDEKIHHKFEEFSNTLKEANKLLEEKVNDFLTKTFMTTEYISFLKENFIKLSEFIQVEVIFSILKRYNLSKTNVLEIIKLINSDRKNLKIIFKDSFTFVKEYQQISIFYKKLEEYNVDFIINGIGTYKVNDTITVNVNKNTNTNIPNKEDLWYNSNMLPIRIRSRKNGDKILLDSGYKKVKDILIDSKIGILKRERILILEKDNEILAILGVKKSKSLKELKNNDILIKVENNNG